MTKPFKLLILGCLAGFASLTANAPARAGQDADLAPPPEEAAETVELAAVAIAPPIVEFLSMESGEPVEAPKADTETISELILQNLKTQFADKRIRIIALDPTVFEKDNTAISMNEVYRTLRKGKDSEAIAGLRSSISEAAPGSDVLFVRTRFYLDYWARSGRGWQVATSILSADRTDKRMVMDARLFHRDDLAEVDRILLQERTTPRSAEGEIVQTVKQTVDAFWGVEKKGDEND